MSVQSRAQVYAALRKPFGTLKGRTQNRDQGPSKADRRHTECVSTLPVMPVDQITQQSAHWSAAHIHKQQSLPALIAIPLAAAHEKYVYFIG